MREIESCISLINNSNHLTKLFFHSVIVPGDSVVMEIALESHFGVWRAEDR